MNDIFCVPLTGGKVAIVDREDAALVSHLKWFAALGCGIWYAHRSAHVPGRPPVCVRMHRVITGVTDPSTPVDHRNRCGLDNRRSNLRVCDDSRNRANCKKPFRSRGSTSRFKGVHRYSKSWIASIRVRGRLIHLGSFLEEVAAARAYDEAATEHFGEFARTNEMLGLYKSEAA